MSKDRIILKTHGLRNSSEVGLVVLPESFYVKVHIDENGDFDVEFINSSEEQLFSVCHQVNKDSINRTPTTDELREAQHSTAEFIVADLARFMFDDEAAAYDTERNLGRWAAQVAFCFHDYTRTEGVHECDRQDPLDDVRFP